MKLNKLYSLRNEFTIIGVTGKIGGGSSAFSKLLSDKMLIKNINIHDQNLDANNADDIMQIPVILTTQFQFKVST